MPTPNYRKLAFEKYAPICAYCSFGVQAVLEVAHLDCDRDNNDLCNLVILCPTCHKMHDIGLIPTRVIVKMRDTKRKVNWKIRMKDAGKKAKETRLRRQKAFQKKWREAGRKSWEARRRNNGEI